MVGYGAIARPQGRLTPVFDGLWTRVNALMAPNPSFGLARFGKAAYALVRGDVISSSCHLQEASLEGDADGFGTN